MSMDRFRNKVAQKLCNWILKHIATKDYRTKLDLVIRQGLMHASLGGPYIYENEENQN